MQKTYAVYIMTNSRNTVLYTGMTGNLKNRVYSHKNKLVPGFTARYNLTKLVYYEMFRRPEEAIMAEKKIKGWTRRKKEMLIEERNPEWKDLAE